MYECYNNMNILSEKECYVLSNDRQYHASRSAAKTVFGRLPADPLVLKAYTERALVGDLGDEFHEDPL